MEAVRVLPWAEYLAHPGRLHAACRLRGGTPCPDPGLVLDLSQPDLSCVLPAQDRRGEVLVMVESCEQLAKVKKELLSKLLLLRVTVIHTQVANKYSVETIAIVEDDFAVLINTASSRIHLQLQDALSHAARCLSVHRPFCLEIDLTSLMTSWYTEQRDAITSCDDIHSLKLRRSRLYVTNHSVYCHKLDCSPKWIVFLCLCWILSAPCYKVYRKLTCTDIVVSLQAEVTSVGLTASSAAPSSRMAPSSHQRGYDAV